MRRVVSNHDFKPVPAQRRIVSSPVTRLTHPFPKFLRSTFPALFITGSSTFFSPEVLNHDLTMKGRDLQTQRLDQQILQRPFFKLGTINWQRGLAGRSTTDRHVDGKYMEYHHHHKTPLRKCLIDTIYLQDIPVKTMAQTPACFVFFSTKTSPSSPHKVIILLAEHWEHRVCANINLSTVPSSSCSTDSTTVETEGFLTELGAQVKMQGGLIRDHAIRLEELSPALFERKRSHSTFRSRIWMPVFSPLEAWEGQMDAQRAALWHAISDVQGGAKEPHGIVYGI
ncbi:hypothetical protein Tco_0294139 [Tanacetum coccineum]